MNKTKAVTRKSKGAIRAARVRIVKRLGELGTGELKSMAARSELVSWTTLYRVGRGRTPDPHISVLEEAERLLDE